MKTNLESQNDDLVSIASKFTDRIKMYNTYYIVYDAKQKAFHVRKQVVSISVYISYISKRMCIYRRSLFVK